MPRIKAASVAEHVAEQEAAVFNAAIALFVERGYEQVTLADIAASIGLARNSLYRYFPDKAHILLRWFEREVPRQVERTTAILSGAGTPSERIEAWGRDQLRYARDPEHELISSIGAIVPELDAAARAQLASAHEQLLRPLRDALADAGVAVGDRQLLAELLQGMVVALARHLGRDQATDPETALEYLARAVRGLLAG